MSSFRIDRQYVSFAAAETKSVISPAEPESRGQTGGADGQKAQLAAAAQAEKLLHEAEQKAALLLEKARAQAEELLRKAESEAAETAGKAAEQAGRVLKEAEKTGYAEGMKTAGESAEKRKREEARELILMEQKLAGNYSALVDGMREDIILLVMNIVKKVIEYRLCESDETFLSIVNSALEQLKQSKTVILHVGTGDYNRYFGKGAEERFRAGAAGVVVTEEEDFAPGDLVAESEGEMLDYSVGRQLERIEKALREGA